MTGVSQRPFSPSKWKMWAKMKSPQKDGAYLMRYSKPNSRKSSSDLQKDLE